MIRISEQTGGRLKNRSKPLSVHWIALTFAEMGELEKAEGQMHRLSKFSGDEPHYRVRPWVEIGWKQRQREESAKAAVDKALQFAQDIPASLQESWNEAVSLSALLTVLNRTAETRPLMQRKLGRCGRSRTLAEHDERLVGPLVQSGGRPSLSAADSAGEPRMVGRGVAVGVSRGPAR